MMGNVDRPVTDLQEVAGKITGFLDLYWASHMLIHNWVKDNITSFLVLEEMKKIALLLANINTQSSGDMFLIKGITLAQRKRISTLLLSGFQLKVDELKKNVSSGEMSAEEGSSQVGLIRAEVEKKLAFLRSLKIVQDVKNNVS